MLHRDNSWIGPTSALLAVTIPEGALSYIGKFLFALVTAGAAQVVSGFIRDYMQRKK